MRLVKFNLVFLVCFVLSGISVAQSNVIRILPLGNSLTYGYYDGTQTAGDCIGYRYKLYTLLNGAGYSFDFVGHKSSGYNYFSDSQNGGISGIKDEQLASVMANGTYNSITVTSGPYLNTYPADVILLEVGTNDWIKEEIYTHQVAQLNTLFNAVDAYETANNTEVLIIAARVINKKNTNHVCEGPLSEWKVEYYNDVLEALVNTRISAGDKIKFIDLQCGAGIDYTDDMLNDYHPKQSGYDKMGQKWFDEINNINTAPVLTTISVSPVPEGTAFAAINLDSYVTDDHSADADITWTVSPAPAHYSVSIVNRVATVTQIDPYWNGSEAITFVATDDGYYIEKLKKSTSQAVTFVTNAVNNVPVILTQLTAFNLNEDTSFEITLNDLQVQDDDAPSAWTLHILPNANYTVVGNTVTPILNYTGQLNVSVTVSDLVNTSNVFNVVANYSALNDAPVINISGPLTTAEDVPLEINITDLNYYDPDNTLEQLTLYILSGTNYTVNGHVITPSENFNGQLQVNVRLRDLTLYSDVYCLTISCTPVNDAPEITSTPVTPWSDNVNYEYQLIAVDADTDEVTFSAISMPDWLDIDSETGLLSGTPSNNDVGTYHVSLGAFDGTVTTPYSFDLEIFDGNSPPHFTNNPDTLAGFNSVYAWTAEVSDLDGDEIEYIPVKIPYFLTFLAESGYLTGTPSEVNEGIHMVRIGASDGTDTTVLEYLLYVGDYTGIIDHPSVSDMFTLYPNPASSYLKIAIQEPVEKSGIKIIDLTGSVVAEYQNIYLNSDALATIDISDVPAGAYFIVLLIDQKVFTQKLLITRSIF